MTSTKIDTLAWADPIVKEWFINNLGLPTGPQEQGWPSILAKKNTLISAPTGSGKTLSAFLICIDKLVRESLAGTLQQKTEIIYVSPLKALSNDIQKNLMQPLAEINTLAQKHGRHMEEIEVVVRTGDTPQRERVNMLKKPPHILVTTPESLYIMLTAEKSRAMLKTVNTIIIDEIHAVADDKRGAHLALSIERLEALCKRPLLRIGLSATQKPLQQVGHFLVGTKHKQPTIIDIGHAKKFDLAIEVPNSELGAVASNEMWDEIYVRLAEHARQNRSTLIFVNTRRLAERVAHHLSEHLGGDKVAAHHGSLSRKLRLAAETKLKNGELSALVATASLELGIDIGTVDLVCQIGSPRAISAALQRIGRAGHWHSAVSKGRLFVTTRDELLECAALVHAIREGELDQLIFPEEPIDILSQQMIAACASEDWHEDDLFLLCKKAYPYRALSREMFESVLTMLSDGIAGSRGRYGAYLLRDRVNKIVKGRRGSRLNAITNGGAIPENGLFTVIAEPNGVMVGTLDEDFAVESNRGDIILLGTTSWIIKRIENTSGRVLVEDAHGAPPSVPFWRGEAPARTDELSKYVSDLRDRLSNMLPIKKSSENIKHPDAEIAIEWLKKHCGVDQAGAEQLVVYIQLGQTILGTVPTQKRIIAERFFDEGGGMQLIIHAPFGARINKAWGLALRKKFCRSFNFELQAAATDNGINIALGEQHSFPLSDVFQFLHPNTIKDVLVQAVLQSPLFPTRWRWVASRSLALIRFRRGKKIPPNITRMLSDDLLAAVFPDAAACQDNLGGRDVELPDHPLIYETMKELFTDVLDLTGFNNVLKDILNNKIECIAIDTPTPSVFSHEILNANPYAYLDDAPLEERRARAVEMRRVLPESVSREIGKLDKTAIEEVQKQAWPDIRNADELHDALQTFIALPSNLPLNAIQTLHSNWHILFSELLHSNRAGTAAYKDRIFWFAAEKAKTFVTIYPDAILLQTPPAVEENILDQETAILHMVRGWILQTGPITSPELSNVLALNLSSIDQALLKLESMGLILQGQFRENTQGIEWCERRLLARIHRLTIGKLRREIKPVTISHFINWLLHWQHLLPGTHLRGEQGLLEVIRKLQGFEIPANAWEKQIFAKRISDYNTNILDHLCLTGVIGWGRISLHSTLQAEINIGGKANKQTRITPTSIAPITFFIREESEWIPAKNAKENYLLSLSHAAKSIYKYLEQRGASFFMDIVRGSRHLKSEVEMGLWELVAAGLVTADNFDNLRALIAPKRRLTSKRKYFIPRLNSGRWSILHTEETIDSHKQVEACCWMLLRRYGIVFRDLIVREKNLPRWRELLLGFRRLEDRGEIRGGRFVDGFLGEQFALPYAVNSLRNLKHQNQTVTVGAVDPLNLIGIILPGQRVSAISKKSVTLTMQAPDFF